VVMIAESKNFANRGIEVGVKKKSHILYLKKATETHIKL